MRLTELVRITLAHFFIKMLHKIRIFRNSGNRAKAEGLNVSVKFVQDDCALESEDKAVGRRGLLGGIATLKILSAAAEEGKNLQELDAIFDQITDPENLGTIGFSTSGCSLPVGNTGTTKVA